MWRDQRNRVIVIVLFALIILLLILLDQQGAHPSTAVTRSSDWYRFPAGRTVIPVPEALYVGG